MDTSDKATADRLRRVYRGEGVDVVYGEFCKKRGDAIEAGWWWSQDERAAIRSWLAMMEQRDQEADAAIDDAVRVMATNFKDYGEVM